MLENPASSALARAIIALARTRKTGVLHAQGEGREASLAFVDGTPRAVSILHDGGACLGDLLAAAEALDTDAHRRALEEREPEGPVGRFLVEAGAARASAVSYALRKQQELRVASLFQWGVMELRFEARAPEIGVPLIEEPIPAAELVLAGMRASLEPVPLHLLRRRVGDGRLSLTGFGEILLEGAVLYPEETAMLAALRRRASVAEILMEAKGRARAVRSLAGLSAIGAAASPSPGSMSYGLLLKKRNQLRRAEGPEALLELPRGGDPRASLRRFVGALHPDKFEAGAPAPLARLSSEVLAALVGAEAELQKRRRGDNL